jgi:hypothetical protein
VELQARPWTAVRWCFGAITGRAGCNRYYLEVIDRAANNLGGKPDAPFYGIHSG